MSDAELITTEAGGAPTLHAGWDNGGSTGYAWTVAVEDPKVVRYFKTDGKGRDTRAICGGGCDFEFEFHGIAAGRTTVRIFHGPSWEPAAAPVRQFTMVVTDPTSPSAITDSLNAANQQLQALQEAAQSAGVDCGAPAASADGATTSEATPAAALFNVRRLIADVEPRVRHAADEQARMAKHVEQLHGLRAAYQLETERVAGLRAQVSEAKAALEAKLSEGRDIPMMVASMHRAGMSTMSEEAILGESPAESARRQELLEAQEALREQQQLVTSLTKELATLQAQL